MAGGGTVSSHSGEKFAGIKPVNFSSCKDFEVGTDHQKLEQVANVIRERVGRTKTNSPHWKSLSKI